MRFCGFKTALFSITGKIRSHNEDNATFFAYCLAEDHGDMPEVVTKDVQPKENFAVAVFDGMGGESAGEKASYTAARCLAKRVPDVIWNKESIKEVFLEMNKEVCSVMESGHYKQIGTTVALFASCEGKTWIANVGDSIVFHLKKRALGKMKLQRVSVEHTDKAFLEEQKITERKPSLTQFLGIREDEFAIEPYIASIRVKRGERILLCSDGLTDMLDDNAIAGILKGTSDVAESAYQLAQGALQAGGRDNISVLILQKQ